MERRRKRKKQRQGEIEGKNITVVNCESCVGPVFIHTLFMN
jgi:hypothetical protein